MSLNVRAFSAVVKYNNNDVKKAISEGRSILNKTTDFFRITHKKIEIKKLCLEMWEGKDPNKIQDTISVINTLRNKYVESGKGTYKKFDESVKLSVKPNCIISTYNDDVEKVRIGSHNFKHDELKSSGYFVSRDGGLTYRINSSVLKNLQEIKTLRDKIESNQEHNHKTDYKKLGDAYRTLGNHLKSGTADQIGAYVLANVNYEIAHDKYSKTSPEKVQLRFFEDNTIKPHSTMAELRNAISISELITDKIKDTNGPLIKSILKKGEKGEVIQRVSFSGETKEHETTRTVGGFVDPANARYVAYREDGTKLCKRRATKTVLNGVDSTTGATERRKYYEAKYVLDRIETIKEQIENNPEDAGSYFAKGLSEQEYTPIEESQYAIAAHKQLHDRQNGRGYTLTRGDTRRFEELLNEIDPDNEYTNIDSFDPREPQPIGIPE